MARTVSQKRKGALLRRRAGKVKAEGVKSEPKVKQEFETLVKKEPKVKIEEGSQFKKESDVVKHEPMLTRSRKRAQDSENVKAEKKPKKEVESDAYEVPEKSAFTLQKGTNQDTRDRGKRKWEIVSAQEGRFILNPKSMSWVKVGSEGYKNMLADPANAKYLERTPVVEMDGRRWSTYGPPSSQAIRRKMPAQIFLIPEERKYPVATKAGERPWSSGLRAAMARARLPISRNPKIFAKALDLMYAHYQDKDQSLPGVKNREKVSSTKAKALSRLLSDRLTAHPNARPEDMPPLEKGEF